MPIDLAFASKEAMPGNQLDRRPGAAASALGDAARVAEVFRKSPDAVRLRPIDPCDPHIATPGGPI